VTSGAPGISRSIVTRVEERSFYTVADSAYFPGAAALVNSLRLSRNDGRIVVLDCGLRAEQRERLAREAEVIPAPADAHPWFVKWLALLERPADVMVLLDSDMVVVRPLAPLVATAAAGKAVVFADLNPVRFREEWKQLVGREVERRTYVNSGFLAVRAREGLGLLAHLQEAQQRLAAAWGDGDDANRQPFKYPDQDVLNAVLAAHLKDEAIEVVEHRLGPTQPFARLRLRDVRSLDCSYPDGARPYLLHHLYAKPWLAWTPTNPYTRLLPRLLLGDDVPVPLRPDEVPLRLRRGLVGEALRDGLVVPRVANAARFKARLELRRAWARASGRATSTLSDRGDVARAR
jgi:hypothetical protein